MHGKLSLQAKSASDKALIGRQYRLNVRVMKHILSIALVFTLAGCAGGLPDLRNGGLLKGLKGTRTPEPRATPQQAPITSSPLVSPPADATTAEDFDTTTSADRETALLTPPDGSDGRIGTTIASLGDPAESGFWIKTPLVSEQTSGRVVYEVSGRSVQVQLIPSGGAVGSGSQVSLATMRLLDAPLTELPELVVYKN